MAKSETQKQLNTLFDSNGCDSQETTRFYKIFNTYFDGNLKSVNDALKKHIQTIQYKKQFNKTMYEKNKENHEFIEKKKNMIKHIIWNIKKHYLKNEKKNIVMILNSKR